MFEWRPSAVEVSSLSPEDRIREKGTEGNTLTDRQNYSPCLKSRSGRSGCISLPKPTTFPVFPSYFIHCGTMGPRCNVASPRHYFGRTEVSLTISRVGLRRWQLSLRWILFFDCRCLRKSAFSPPFYFICAFPRERGCFSATFCVSICIYLCMNLWNCQIRI